MSEYLRDTVQQGQPAPWTDKGPVDAAEPMSDGRVIWLIEETCNRQALFHRYEDVRRRDRGGKWDGSGYPFVQTDDQAIENLSARHDPDEEQEDSLHAADSRRAWRGLVAMVECEFGANDDVPVLIQVLAQNADVQEAFQSQWPIAKIVHALNECDPKATWNDDRVDNAKRRLTKWIVRMRKSHGLDAIDFRALLARFAREREGGLQRA